MITLSDENSSRAAELARVRTPSIPRIWIAAGNYFFECCIWIAYAIYSTPCSYGAIAWLGPAIILGSILRVTGIPATEAQALRSKSELYRAYQARVSAFVPWPPRSSKP
jgi:steroid 5-alpha reductase family enzyme